MRPAGNGAVTALRPVVLPGEYSGGRPSQPPNGHFFLYGLSCGTTMVTLAVVVFPAKSVAWYVRVYTRPGPTPERSARRRTRVSSVPTSALWMSFVVSPSPTPLSGSLLVADTRTTRTAPRLSLAATERTTSTIRWSGGQRIRGLAVTERTGGVLSTTHARVAGLESALPAAAMAEATRSCHQPSRGLSRRSLPRGLLTARHPVCGYTSLCPETVWKEVQVVREVGPCERGSHRARRLFRAPR